jgi:hypothetical protein
MQSYPNAAHMMYLVLQQISKSATSYPAIQPYDTLLMELLPSHVIRGVAQASATFQSQAITFHNATSDSNSSKIRAYSALLRINSTGMS